MKRGQIKAVLSDIDGTLLSTKPITKALQRASRKLNVRVFTEKEIKRGIMGRKILPAFRKLRPEHAGKAAQFKQEYYKEYAKLRQVALPTVKHTLAVLKKRGVKTAAVTTKGKPIARFSLRSAGLRCDVVISGDDVKHAKPHPEPVLKALKKLRVRPCEAVMVGDMVFDVQAGRRAGCATAGVTTGISTRRELKKAGADRIFESFAQVLKII